MTYVYDVMASEIKRKPTEKEKIEVERSNRRSKELYEKYNNKTFDNSMRKRLWNEYLRENEKYNNLFNKYIGYCY